MIAQFNYFYHSFFAKADLTRQWTDIKEKVEKEIFRLCRSLFVLRNVDNTLFDIKHVLKQWFAFCDGSSERTSNDYSLEESDPSNMVDSISQVSKLVDDAINVVQKYNFTDYKFGKNSMCGGLKVQHQCHVFAIG